MTLYTLGFAKNMQVENLIGKEQDYQTCNSDGILKGKDKSGKDKSKIKREAIDGFMDRMGAQNV